MTTTTIYTIAAIAALIFVVAYFTEFNFRKLIEKKYLVVVAAALLVRLIAMQIDVAYEADLNTFKSWAMLLFRGGMSNFYTADYFTDYPPGYMYVLYVVGGIGNLFSFTFESNAYTLLIKLPAMICDVLTAVFVLKIAEKWLKPNIALILSLAYVLNPAIIVNSTVWGQVDSVYSLVLLASIYMLTEKRYFMAFMLFAVDVLIKPQSLIFTPVFLYGAYAMVKESGFSAKAFSRLFAYGSACIATLFVLMLPFTKNFDFMPIFKQYYSTLASYPYASLNAYNFYALIGANWAELTGKFLFFSYSTWGVIFIVAATLLSFYLIFTRITKANFFFVAALLNALTFMFSVKMHERYLYPTILLLFAAYIYKRDKRLIPLIFGYSLTLFINCVDVLIMLLNGNDLKYLENTLPILSFINMGLTVYMVYISFTAFKKGTGEDEAEPQLEPEPISVDDYKEEATLQKDKHMTSEMQIKMQIEMQKTVEIPKLNKNDFVIMLVLSLVYAVIAFYNLGDNFAPETNWVGQMNDTITVDFGESKDIDRVLFFTGYKEERQFTLQTSDDGVTFSDPMTIESRAVFDWKDIPFIVTARYVKLQVSSDMLVLNELAFRSGNELLNVVACEPDAITLFDEQSLVPFWDGASFKNGTYFDEIYHARTAYEFINKLYVYEWTHPPLGKVIIAAGIKLFGMNPWGWRFMGTLFGIFMVPLMYIFGKAVLKNTFWATFVATVFTFDFMHFAQTRIATIDTYVTIFIIAMYYFMYRYVTMSFYDTKLKKTLVPLFASGVFMGLSIASKWQGVYASLGLAFMFFYSLYKRYSEAKHADENEHENLMKQFNKKALITVGCCLLFFVVVPLGIYAVSYLPFVVANGVSGFSDSVREIIKNQGDMLHYHGTLVSEHPYSSSWWSWPFDIRPIFYYANTTADGLKQGISSFGNPAVWWAGVVAIVYAIKTLSSKTRFNLDMLFLIVGFLSSFVPWIIISRTTYIYHYFPCVPFFTILIGLMFRQLVEQKGKRGLYATYGYVTVVIGLFIMFYPVLSGMDVDALYVMRFLRWLPGWQFI